MKSKNLIIMVLALMFTVNGAYAAPKSSNQKSSSQSKSVSQKSSKKEPSKPVVHKSNSKVVYSKKTPAVSSIRSLPSTAKVFKRNGVNYHYHDGRYYRFLDGRYILSSPPRGLRVPLLPSLATRMLYNGIYYHYLNGVYYVESKGEYEVVDSPQDIIVDYLPEEAEEVYINDKRYFAYDQTLYTVITTPTGKSFKAVAQLEE